MKHNKGKFRGQENLNLYYQYWLPDDRPRAALLLIHGFAEHSDRYINPVCYFVPKGYAVYDLDRRGYGKSEGLLSYVEQFSYPTFSMWNLF